MFVTKSLLAGTVLLIAGATPALERTVQRPITSAHSYPSQNNSTRGASATCSLISWKDISYLRRDNYAQITCQIRDTGNDNNQVYVKWWQDGYGDIHLTNSQGYRTTVSLSDARYNPDGSFGNAYWEICRDIRFGRDNCSTTKSWRIR
jgi:hypothetical protein